VWGRRARLGLGLALLAAGLSTPAVAQRADGAGRPDTLTAEAAVGRALAANPTVEARRQGRRAAAASVREARGEWFPTLRGTARYRRLSDNVDYTVDLPSLPGGGGQPVTFAPAILNRYSVRAGVEQPLFTGFRVSNQLEAARARRGAARAQVETTRQAVAYETRTAYWRLYEARSRAEAAADALRLIERRLVDVRNRRGQGMATEADVLRVRARRDRVRVERVRAQNAVQAARRALNEQMGRPVDAPVVLADTVRVGVATVDSTGLVARARAQRPDLEVLRATVRARAAEVDVAQSSWYPQVSLTGSYLYARPNEQLFPPEERFEGTWEAGVRLSWHLSLGRQTDAAVDRARARRLEARYELRDRRRSAAVEVKTQVEAVAQAREAVRAAQTSVQSARAAYRSVRTRYDEEMVPVSDLLDAEQALRRSRARLATAQADLARARAALDRALGRDVPR
jgi:outer membrane protein TolC